MSNANAQKTLEKETEMLTQQSVLLDIAPRLQWVNGHGYCGETSIQSIGLYYGAWISQGLIRDINKGEYLLPPALPDDRRDPSRTLKVLHLTYSEWDWMDSPEPQFRSFCHWIKQSILRRYPVIFCVFLPHEDDEDYDHIVPAVGIRYRNENQYDPDDELIYNFLLDDEQFDKKMNEDELGSTREAIDTKKDANGGCIPLNVDYGLSITGIVDEDRVTLPIRLSVSAWDEPNPASHEGPREMNGIVTVYNLTVDKSYVLLRYSSYKYVPTRGNVHTFLQSNFDEKHKFTAIETKYVYKDPKTISSTGSVYYRCVPMPDCLL